MSTTKPDTDTGWSKEWPNADDSFYWMRWLDGRYRILPVHVQGIHLMCLFDKSYSQRGDLEGRVEFLGSISPSDFEQLMRLRIIAQNFVTAYSGKEHQLGNGQALRSFLSFREALAHTGEQEN